MNIEFRWLQKPSQDIHYPFRGETKYVTVPGERLLQWRLDGGDWQTSHDAIEVFFEPKATVTPLRLAESK